jgi:hypothetical protein
MTVACSPETMSPFLLAVFSQAALTVSEWTLIGLVLNFFIYLTYITEEKTRWFREAFKEDEARRGVI